MLFRSEFAQRARANLAIAHDAIIEARVLSTHQANRLRTEDKADEGVGVEDKEDGEGRAENEEMRDTEMEESGADMADNAMDETLH